MLSVSLLLACLAAVAFAGRGPPGFPHHGYSKPPGWSKPRYVCYFIFTNDLSNLMLLSASTFPPNRSPRGFDHITRSRQALQHLGLVTLRWLLNLLALIQPHRLQRQQSIWELAPVSLAW